MPDPVLPGKRFPNDEKAKAAEARALVEIEKLNKLLTSMGHPPVSLLEKAILITYLKAKDLGLLDDHQLPA